jgi:hypothetical protein
MLDPMTAVGLVVTAALAVYTISGMVGKGWLPMIVDAVLAAVSVVISIAHLTACDSYLPYKLFDSKMMSSAVVFCTNTTPPSPRAFIACTASAFVAGVLLHYFGTFGLSADAIATGLNLLLAKLSGNSFSATVGLTAFVGRSPWASWDVPLRYLSVTWLAGHAFLYAFAYVAAAVRRAARQYLTQRSWAEQMRNMAKGDAAGGEDAMRSALKELFHRYDTSGDGRIDATEFRVAMRAFTGVDVPLSDCEATVRAFDADGSGTIDLGEFELAILGSDGIVSSSRAKGE